MAGWVRGEKSYSEWDLVLSLSLSCDALQSALLEEQKSVMQKCSEERRKLAAEWAEFHTRQQLSKEWMERDMDRVLQMDSQREGTIMSLAKVPQWSPLSVASSTAWQAHRWVLPTGETFSTAFRCLRQRCHSRW